MREFIPRYSESPRTLLGQLRHFHATIHGNRDYVKRLVNRSKFVDDEKMCQRDLVLFDDNNVERIGLEMESGAELRSALNPMFD